MTKNEEMGFDLLEPFISSDVTSWHFHRPFAQDLITELKPNVFVELGVHKGDSYFSFCQSVKSNKLKTICYAVDHWQGDAHAGKYSGKAYSDFEKCNTRNFSDFSYIIPTSFDEAVQQFSDHSIDLLHIDGFHTYENVKNDFYKWLPKLSSDGIILLHDIHERQADFGVWKLWEELSLIYSHFSFSFGHGLGVLSLNKKPDQPIKIGSLVLDKIKFQRIHEYYKKVSLSFIYSQKNKDLSSKIRLLTGRLAVAYDYVEKLESKLFKIEESTVEDTSSSRGNIKPEKVFDSSRGSSIRTHFDLPSRFFPFSSSNCLIKGSISVPKKLEVRGLYLSLGRRSIRCSLEFASINSQHSNDSNEILFSCSFRTRVGFKYFKLYLLSEDGTSSLLGSRLIFITSLIKGTLLHTSHFGHVPILDPYEQWLSYNKLTSQQISRLSYLDSEMSTGILYSFIMPVYNTKLDFLKEAIFSILNQTYTNWELCIVDDGSTDNSLLEYLQLLPQKDDRIKVTLRELNGGISCATNDAIAISIGEFLVFIDHDDLIEHNALSEFNLCISKNQSVDFIYSDDDKIDSEGNRYSPQFKPDWSPELLLSYCYISHMKVVRSELSKKIGHFREGFEGSQDYDYILRLCENTCRVSHIPKILYHWRVSPGSTAASGDAKPKAFECGLKALTDALSRRSMKGDIRHPLWAQKEKLGIYQILFPDKGPEVTILIPTRNNKSLLQKCLNSLKCTTYENYRILVLDNESDDMQSYDHLRNLEHEVKEVPSANNAFNFSYIVNEGVKSAKTEYVLLLNDDTEVINPRWLSQMVGFLKIEGVGCVGAKLLFSNNQIQHAGVIHGLASGYPGTAFRNQPSENAGYLNYLRTPRNYSAITAACMLTTRKLFLELGGFDQEKFAVAYNDVDFCYRLISFGKRCVYCPDAILFHHEGSSRGFTDNLSELAAFKTKYRHFKDSYYNPNLSLENHNFEVSPRRIPYPVKKPLRVLAITHNLNFEGAPISMFEMLSGLTRKLDLKITVISMGEGSLGTEYEKLGIVVKTVPFNARNISESDFNIKSRIWSKKVGLIEYDVLYANTIDTFFAIYVANQHKIPSVWNIRESATLSQLFQGLSPKIAQIGYDCFKYPYRTVFVSESTSRIYTHLNTTGNFSVINNGINFSSMEECYQKEDLPNIPEDEKMILCVGTICKRKGQLDLLKAFEQLPNEMIKSTTLVFVGAKDNEYARVIAKKVSSNAKIKKKVLMVGSKSGIKAWYDTAYLYVSTSYGESYPRVILEAMHHSLPILTTPVFGVPEQVIENTNALFFNPGDILDLRDKLSIVLADKKLRDSLAHASSQVLKTKTSYDMMLEQYRDTFLEAASMR